MKNLIFRLALLALAGLTITLYSCQQEDIFEDVKEEVVLQDADMDLRGPNILATSVVEGSCCSYKNRRVHITLDQIIYNFYCSNGRSLTYKFYRNPGASPIVKTSSSATPSFCLSPRSYTLVITDGVSSSPTYTANLSGSCYDAPSPLTPAHY